MKVTSEAISTTNHVLVVRFYFLHVNRADPNNV